MSGKQLLIVLCLITIFYPGYSIYQLEAAIQLQENAALAQNRLLHFQISIWIVWVIYILAAIYYKWVKKGNFLFYFTYGFLLIAFGLFGFYTQVVVNDFNLSSPFRDQYSHGIFTAVQNIVISGALTAFLQAAVWWFTRKWHRK
ncbi:hypothetical protein [Salinimicrobium sp. GXAS 041]|uniref:hypothetical protein n=1 Tax=Salinimicrobium sp. GXAS 041 TaxID=3400806 RepID=UPI003C73A00C